MTTIIFRLFLLTFVVWGTLRPPHTLWLDVICIGSCLVQAIALIQLIAAWGQA